MGGGPPGASPAGFLPPSVPTGKYAFWASGEQGGVSPLQAEKELRSPGAWGGPEATGCFKQQRVLSCVPGGQGRLLRRRRRNVEVQRDWRQLVTIIMRERSKIRRMEGARECAPGTVRSVVLESSCRGTFS